MSQLLGRLFLFFIYVDVSTRLVSGRPEPPRDAGHDRDDVPHDLPMENTPGYDFELHINTSAPSSANGSPPPLSPEDHADQEVYGGETPPPPIFHPAELTGRAREQLGDLWDQGLDILAQMLAQELQRLAQRETDPCAHRILQSIADEASMYIAPNMEVGVLLAPRWIHWLQDLRSHALHALRPHELVDPGDREQAREDDGAASSSCPTNDGFSASSEDEERGLDAAPSTSPKAKRSRASSPPHEDEQVESDTVTLAETSRHTEADDRRSRSRSRERSRRARRSGETRPTPARTSPWSSRPWRPAPWREEARSRQGPREPPCPPPQRSSRRAPATERTQAEEALSLNRHTWRDLLGLSAEGTGSNYTEYIAVPLRTEAMENILATVANLDEGQRVAFISSFMRFIMELAQQVCEGIVVGRANVDPNDFQDFDNMMMLQQTKVQTWAHDLAEEVDSPSLMQDQELPAARVRRLAQSLQRALEQSGDRQSRRARTLHQRVTARYFGVCHEEVHNEVHELDAVLIVYDDNREGSELNVLEAEDRGWVEEWWGKG